MPYDLILLVAVIVLVWRHSQRPEISERARGWVIGVVAVSIVLRALMPAFFCVALVLQLGVCLWLIFLKLIADAKAEIVREEARAGRDSDPE